LISGGNRLGAEEEAFFELLEMPGDVMAALTIGFRIDLLAEAVNESDEEIWQEALDGPVALASWR